MVYGFEGYTPYFNEDTELPSLVEDTPLLLSKVANNMINTTSTIATSFNQKVNTDLIQHFLVHPDIEINDTNFLNQVTLAIKIRYQTGESRTVNTKIFTFTNSENKPTTDVGTVHMTGARTITEAKLAIEKLIGVLRKMMFRVNIDGGLVGNVYPVDDIDTLNIETMVFKYFMHNSVLKLPSYCYGSLYERLKDDGYDVSFNPNVYAGVVLKMVIDGVNVSYILFRSGKTTTSIACPGTVCVKELKVKIFNTLESLYRKHYNDIQINTYNLPKKTTPAGCFNIVL
jgi:TATA-box binding protein (TBP) (component of TFIID and TFIIIB)